MNMKKQIIQEIELFTEEQLAEVLQFVRYLKSPQEKIHSKAVQVFLASLEERKEVYQRLADS